MKPQTLSIAQVGKQVSFGPNTKRKGTDHVENRYYTKEEYAALDPDQKKALALKRAKRSHKPGSKSSPVQPKGNTSLARTVAAFTKTVNKLTSRVAKDSPDDSTTDSEPTNRDNAALTRTGKAKKQDK